jgi:tRNA-specific 2-thiouridylase
LKLPVFNKPDSQEICFVPNNDYAGLVERRTPGGFRPGEFVDTSGNVLGTHPGHQNFTVGQRKGLRVALGHPIYVESIDPSTNRVTLADKDALLKRSLVAHQINLLDESLRGRSEPFACTAKIRYNHDPQPARAIVSGADELTVTFDEPQSAITPGQAVVLYDGERALGGGWIDVAQSF